MKIIKNKSVKIKGEQITYAELVESCLNQTPATGFTYEDIKVRQRIEHACKKESKDLKLEDADYTKLSELVKSMRWGVRAEGIIQFTDDILNAK